MTAPAGMLERLKRLGPRTAVRFLLCKLNDHYQAWRLGIHGALKFANRNILRRELGYENPEFVGHNPTESFTMFRLLMQRHVRPTRNDVFLDYGSGAGRVLIMAATFPFRRVIGVEYSPELNAIAAKAVGLARERLLCGDIVLETADASRYRLPPEVTVIYLFNPFSGLTLERVFENIHRSIIAAPRRVTIIFFRPEYFEPLAARLSWLVKRAEVSQPAISRHQTSIYECGAGG